MDLDLVYVALWDFSWQGVNKHLLTTDRGAVTVKSTIIMPPKSKMVNHRLKRRDESLWLGQNY